MTTTIVYGDVADGYLHSLDASYTTARNGPGDGVNTGTAAYYGQNNNGGTYTVLQTFIRFAYPAVAAGEVVTSAAIQTYQLSQLSTGTVRDLELRGAPWGNLLTTSDWRTPAQLSSAGLFGVVRGVQASQGKWTSAGSESLRAGVKANAFQELVLITSRQRAGSTPTSDEGASIATADTSGTSSDPRLVFTTVTDHSLIPVMGAEARLSDGSWVYLTAASAGIAELVRETSTGGLTTLGTISLGTGASDVADVPAAQGLTLTVDTSDHIYVVGRAGDAINTLRSRAFIKSAGSFNWSAGTIRSLALPAHDAPINNVTASWTPAGGGTLVVFAGHAAGEGVSGGTSSDVAYALINSQYLLDGSGTQVRRTGSATAAGILPADLTPGHFSGYLNDTGSGLDVVMDPDQTDWGYLVSFRRSQALGGNAALAVGRFNLNATASLFDYVEHRTSSVYATKDASAKVRAISVGSGQVAVVGADADSTYGLSVEVLQMSGGMVPLGSAHLAMEAIPSMPDGPAVRASLAWDAVYSVAENSVWVYYVDVANPNRLMRTSVSLNTYQPTRVEVPVYTAASPILAVRAPRNARVTQKGHVTVALASGPARVVDTFNQAPLAPTLTLRANYDATAAATFAWTFNDPNAGDTQSAYQLQVVRVSDGVTVLDTGKVLSATPSRSVAGGTLANGQSYQWRVMTWDALDVAGPWSTYGSFTTSAGGSVNIITPAVDNPPGVITDDFQITWAVTGTVQAAYRYRRIRTSDGAVITDTGWITSTETSRTAVGMLSDVEYRVEVTVRNASSVESGTGTRLITPRYGLPEVPLVTLTPVPDGGHVLVSVDNPPPGSGTEPRLMYDLEDGTTEPLNSSGTATLAPSTTYAHRGSRSVQVTTTSGGTNVRVKSTFAKAVIPGRRYTAGVWIYSEVGYAGHVATINWRPAADPAGATVATSTGPTIAVPANIWTQVSVTAQCPDGAGWAIWGPSFAPSPSVGYVYWVDEFEMGVASDAPEVVRNRIFRRLVGSTGPWDVLGETEPDGAFRDYSAPSLVPVEYMARGESA